MSRKDETDAVDWQQPGRRNRRGSGPSSRRGRGTLLGGYTRRMKTLGGIAIGLTAVLVISSLYAYVRYREVWDSIKRVNVSADLPSEPPSFGNALNILLIGSDSRAGKNGAIGGSGGIQGQRSDTVLVVHISPAPHRVVVLSFPRDSVVPILKCVAEAGTSGQQAQPGQVEQLNSTFAYGGPGCLWHTLEQTTHIRLNDFVELNFTGFEKVINDLGGVNVCLPVAVHDPMSGLHLSKGRHHIYGKQALAFWRTREDLGLGSDLQRIQRDQFLMISLLQGIEKSGLLGSPTKVAKVIGDAAHAMTTDSGLTQSRMVQIASGLRALSRKSAQFIEVPTVAYQANPNWVQWTPQDSQLFSAIAHNVKVPKIKKGKKSSGTGRAVTVLAEPSSVQVEVLNGSGVAGVASTAAAGLTNRGFDVVGNTNASSFTYTHSVVQYASSADRAKAEAVAAQISGATLQENPTMTGGTVNLILGSSFTALKSKAAAKAAARTSSVSNLAKTYGGLTGNANVCHDQGAFAS